MCTFLDNKLLLNFDLKFEFEDRKLSRIDGLMQTKRNFSALAMGLRLFCVKPTIYDMSNIQQCRFDILVNVFINIDKVNQFKFLCVIIDSHLSWMDHVQHIRKKISKGMGILYKTKDYLKSDTLLNLYYSFVCPYLIYCIEVWGATTKGKLISLL